MDVCLLLVRQQTVFFLLQQTLLLAGTGYVLIIPHLPTIHLKFIIAVSNMEKQTAAATILMVAVFSFIIFQMPLLITALFLTILHLVTVVEFVASIIVIRLFGIILFPITQQGHWAVEFDATIAIRVSATIIYQ